MGLALTKAFLTKNLRRCFNRNNENEDIPVGRIDDLEFDMDNEASSLMRQEGVLIDVTVTFNGVEFPAHKVALAESCGLFKTYFSSLDHVSDKVVPLETEEPEATLRILNFIYSKSLAELDIPKDTLKLITAAEELQARKISQRCCQHLIESLGPENFLQSWTIFEKYNKRDLLLQLVDSIADRLEDISTSESFRQLPIGKLLKIVASEKLADQPWTASRAIFRWLEFDFAAREQHVALLNSYIKFRSFPRHLLVEASENEPIIKQSLVLQKAFTTALVDAFNPKSPVLFACNQLDDCSVKLIVYSESFFGTFCIKYSDTLKLTSRVKSSCSYKSVVALISETEVVLFNLETRHSRTIEVPLPVSKNDKFLGPTLPFSKAVMSEDFICIIGDRTMYYLDYSSYLENEDSERVFKWQKTAPMPMKLKFSYDVFIVNKIVYLVNDNICLLGFDMNVRFKWFKFNLLMNCPHSVELGYTVVCAKHNGKIYLQMFRKRRPIIFLGVADQSRLQHGFTWSPLICVERKRLWSDVKYFTVSEVKDGLNLNIIDREGVCWKKKVVAQSENPEGAPESLKTYQSEINSGKTVPEIFTSKLEIAELYTKAEMHLNY